jgi:hypothetical protein
MTVAAPMAPPLVSLTFSERCSRDPELKGRTTEEQREGRTSRTEDSSELLRDVRGLPRLLGCLTRQDSTNFGKGQAVGSLLRSAFAKKLPVR